MTQTVSSGTSRVRLGPDYWRLWWANAISSTGDGAFVAALPLLAVTISRDPRLVAVVTAASYLPWMLLSLPAGALVDRCDRATLMWRAQAVQAAVVAAVAVLVVFRFAGIASLAWRACCSVAPKSSSATPRSRCFLPWCRPRSWLRPTAASRSA